MTAKVEKFYLTLRGKEKNYDGWDNTGGDQEANLASAIRLKVSSVMRKNIGLVLSSGQLGPGPTIITSNLVDMSPQLRNLCIADNRNMFGYYVSRVSTVTVSALEC